MTVRDRTSTMKTFGMNFEIVSARSHSEIEDIKLLRREYVAWLNIGHISDEFEVELAQLPGKYAPPAGDLFLARDSDEKVLGCIGVRAFDRFASCEIKHLYVRRKGRGSGIGHALAMAAVGSAAATGYREALLSTLPTMISAISVYKSLGFSEIPPYWNNPVPGALFFGKQL